MSLYLRLKKLEQYSGETAKDDIDYSISIGSKSHHKYTKTINGEILDITEGEWIGSVTRAIRNKNFTYKSIKPIFNLK